MMLSPHFSLAEFTQSQTASRLELDNTPSADALVNLVALAAGLEQVREMLGKPITITSGYRSPLVNTAVGSKSTSQHTKGEAADFICPQYGTPAEIVRAIVNSRIEYDQVISEFAGRGQGWVHISFSERKRRQALVIDGNGTRAFV